MTSMQKNPVVGNVNKILVGAILWTIFFIRLFFNETAWNQSFLGQTIPNLYQPNTLFAIELIFFGILNLNLYHYTVGKRHAVLDYSRFFKVFIFIALIVFLSQAASLYLHIPFHFGLIGFFFGEGEFALYQRSLPIETYLIYTASSMMLILYFSGVLIYLYQILKMKLTLSFAYFLRYLLIIFLYGVTLSYTPEGFNIYHLILMSLYVLAALLVYIKTKYSLKALVLAVILLFIL